MSLNRAFIKAYERGRAGSATPEVEARAPSKDESSATAVAPASGNETSRYAPPSVPAAFFAAYRFEGVEATIAQDQYAAPPQYQPSFPPYRGNGADAIENYEPLRVDAPHRTAIEAAPPVEPNQRSGPQTTSPTMVEFPSFASAQAAPNAPDEDENRRFQEPALQVERFAWPEVSNSLLERAERSFHTLCEQVLSGASEGRKLLVITGYRRGEGRTTLVLALARALAARGARVAVVDADVENPGLARQLGVSPEVGWQEVLSNHFPLEEALIESLTDGVTLLPLISQANWLQAFEPASIRRDLEQLRDVYDFVLVDSAPMIDTQGRSQPITLRDLAPADGAIMVHDVSTSSLVNPSITERRLAERLIDWWAIVENFAQSRK